jgi:hypothetical protein
MRIPYFLAQVMALKSTQPVYEDRVNTAQKEDDALEYIVPRCAFQEGLAGPGLDRPITDWQTDPS